MIDVKNLLRNSTGRIVISLILGVGLAALFRQSCVGRNCIILKAPNPNKIKGNVYEFDKKCYTYKTVPSKCNGTALKMYDDNYADN